MRTDLSVASATGTLNRIPVFSTGNALIDSNITQNSTTDFIFGNTTSSASASPLVLSLGGTLGNNTAGSNANLKLRIYDDGTASNRYGIGVSSGLMEFQAGSGAGMRFFINNGSPVISITSGGLVGVGTTTPNTTPATLMAVVGGSSGVQIPVYVSAGGIATRVGINHATNTGFGLYLAAVLKWSIASYNAAGDFAINNDGLGRLHVFSHGGSNNMVIGSRLSVPTDSGFRLDIEGTLRVQGSVTLTDASNLIFATTTGTKIGTATSQKLAFWNATPIVQPTTAVASATLVTTLGVPLTSTDTFDGYTLAQIVKALRNTGLLA
jgi:hypothetical protein